MIDVFYDHFLALNWEQFSPTDFTLQTFDLYEKLNSETSIELPLRMKNTLKMMRERDLFSLYKTQAGISTSIDGISRRIRFENILAGGGEELKKNYHSLRKDFDIFFPELISYVKDIKPAEYVFTA